MIEEQLHKRISHAEDRVRRIQAAPTVPIYDFSVPSPYILESITAHFHNQNDPPDQLVFDLCADATTEPGALITTSVGQSITTSDYYRFTFTPTQLVLGTFYWLVARRTAAYTDDNYYYFHGSNITVVTATSVDNGYYWLNSAGVWTHSLAALSIVGELKYTDGTYAWNDPSDTGVSGPFGLATAGFARKVATRFQV